MYLELPMHISNTEIIGGASLCTDFIMFKCEVPIAFLGT